MNMEILSKLEHPIYLRYLAQKTAQLSDHNARVNSEVELAINEYVITPKHGERYTVSSLDSNNLERGDLISTIYEDGSYRTSFWGDEATGRELGEILANSCLFAAEISIDDIIEFANHPDLEARKEFRKLWVEFYIDNHF